MERHASLGSVLTTRAICWEGGSERPPSRASLEHSNAALRIGKEGKFGEVGFTTNLVSQDKRKYGLHRTNCGCKLQMILLCNQRKIVL